MLKIKITSVWLVFISIVVSCTSSNKNYEITGSSIDTGTKGEQLAKQYCSSCHAFPPAEILPTHYWGRVLPIMGFFLGAGKEKFEFADYSNPVAKKRLTESGLFPETPLLSTQDWISINKYYLDYSPREWNVEETARFDKKLKQFDIEKLPWTSTHEGLTYLNFDNDNYNIGFYTESESYYMKLDANGVEIEKSKVSHPVVDVIKREDGELLLLMGVMGNIDEPTGKLLIKKDSIQSLIEPLERPINFEVEDFNNDGEDEILIAEFGKFLGGINIYTLKDTINKINIDAVPGAVKIIVKDVNNDGLKDFYVLMAQADESVYLFLNKGNFKFEKKGLFRLPAHYGTTNFELLDFDGDGDDDIICSSGDSGDFGIILKPFHGVRLFENKGTDRYEQVWFYPQQGAYGTASADYDNDGDIDIASIGYFASYLERDREMFIYFENKGNDTDKWKFEPHGYDGSTNDCWIVITNGDVDNDGDIDIILGANSKVLDPERKALILKDWQNNGGMVTILKNKYID